MISISSASGQVGNIYYSLPCLVRQTANKVCATMCLNCDGKKSMPRGLEFFLQSFYFGRDLNLMCAL